MSQKRPPPVADLVQSNAMTMEHIAPPFQVSPRVQYQTIDPKEISDALSLVSHGMNRAGAPRTTPKSAPLKVVYEFSHWTHWFDVEGASELGR